MAVLNTSSLSTAIKTLYERRLLTRAQQRLTHGRFGRQATFKGYGDYELRRWENLGIVTTALTEGGTPNESAAPTISTVTFDPAWYGSWVGYTDQVDLESYDPVISEIVALQGYQAGLSMDTLVRNTITAGATKRYSGGATTRATLDTSNDIIQFVDFIQAVAVLEAEAARGVEGDMYAVLIHPHTWCTLMQDSVFVTLFTREGGASLRSGSIGTILNCRLYITSNAREYVDAGENSTEDVYSMLFIGEEAFGLAGVTGLMTNFGADAAGDHVRGELTGSTVNAVDIIVKGIGEGGFDPLNQRGTSGWKVTHDCQILQILWIVDLEHVNDFS